MSHRLLRRSVWDLAKSMYLLRSPGRFVTIFASAKLGRGNEVYERALDLGKALAAAGFAVMTGGGSGLMEAVNRGAREAGGRSLGCRMTGHPFDEEENHFLDRCPSVRYFFVRKVVMCRAAAGFVVLPGGLGTLDELFDVLALIKTGQMPPKPVILLGTAFWQPLLVMFERLVSAGMICPKQMPVIRVTDDVGEAVAFMTRTAGSMYPEPSRTSVVADQLS